MLPMQARRGFGRRDNCAQGWIRVRGRPRILCKVRNRGLEGTFLECAVPAWLPSQFELILEDSNQVLTCAIRHALTGGVGVSFVDQATTCDTGGPFPTTIVEADAWRGANPASLPRPKRQR